MIENEQLAVIKDTLLANGQIRIEKLIFGPEAYALQVMDGRRKIGPLLLPAKGETLGDLLQMIGDLVIQGDVSCTDFTASWCPVHGDCSCVREEGLANRDCLLHGTSSSHSPEVVVSEKSETYPEAGLRSRINKLVSDWQANGNSRELGDPRAEVWHQAAEQLLDLLFRNSGTVSPHQPTTSEEAWDQGFVRGWEAQHVAEKSFNPYRSQDNG